ncbi:cytidine deaminase-like protein [Crepidotus variabilis]|uniref:Cytidine deaminase-like protein n=1 Tax=Crepidotus variabilis TaxID=179855 RepID=A0A9P6EEH1_9AGAR|nr:cytidine deaminase-like protein [Crepidotus variabilis]
MAEEKNHPYFLEIALSEAKKCIPTPTAFCVGCVLVVRLPNASPTILSTGYSRELPGNTHAEANALSKAYALSSEEISALFPSHQDGPKTIDELLQYADVYTTLEPCSTRTSGLAPCVDALIKAKVKRCFIGVGEPSDFVNCEGARKLKDVGIDVVWVDGLQNECLAVARTGRATES